MFLKYLQFPNAKENQDKIVESEAELKTNKTQCQLLQAGDPRTSVCPPKWLRHTRHARLLIFEGVQPKKSNNGALVQIISKTPLIWIFESVSFCSRDQ